MFNPFRFIKQNIAPDILGIDIGTTSIKAVEAVNGERGPRITNYAVLESRNSISRPNTMFQASNLKLFEDDVVGALKELVAKMKPSTRTVSASLPNFSAFTTVLNMPKMSDEEMAQSMAYQAKQYIPMPVSEVVLEWLRVGEMEDENGNHTEQVLLISVPREETAKYQNIFKQAGLNVLSLELEAFSLARALIGSDNSTTLLIDIGASVTSLSVVSGGRLRFLGHSDFAGASLTQALVSALNINPVRAEELKRERGVLGTGPNFELSTIMLPFLDVIISEAKRVRANYETQFAVAPKVERIMLSGGGANLPGIEECFRKRFELPVVKAAPFLRFEYPPELEQLAGELNPILSVALGLVLREL